MAQRPDDATPDWSVVAADVHTLLDALAALQEGWEGAQRPADAQEAQEYLLDVLEVVRGNLLGFQHVVTLLSSVLGRDEV